MFTDIVGYTALMGKDQQKAMQLLDRNRILQKPLIEKCRGKYLKESSLSTNQVRFLVKEGNGLVERLDSFRSMISG